MERAYGEGRRIHENNPEKNRYPYIDSYFDLFYLAAQGGCSF